MTKPRLRFAPSPTGYLHIGGVRTALFNWLWARKTGGTFVLRIEDTDQERSTPENEQIILRELAWLGLHWDEGPDTGGPHGPYRQMERLEIYREFSDRLVASGAAYRCYATKEELDAAREALRAADPKAQFRYPGWWRDKGPADWLSDRPYVIRLRTPSSGHTGWNDLVFGEQRVPNDTIQDVVLVRSDGVPLYNFGCVVDDITMGITLVARGRDHMINTPIQLLVYQALGVTPPTFGHLPMMLGKSGEKLSKRHGAVSVGEYREQGVPALGLLNYLVRFGWSFGDQEVFTMVDLIDKFDWSRTSRADGKFDAAKLTAIAFEHMKRADLMDDDGYVASLLPWLARYGAIDERKLRAVLPTVRPRARTFREAAESVDWLFALEPTFDEKAKEKFLLGEKASVLSPLRDVLASAPEFAAGELEAKVKSWAEERGYGLGDVAQPARVALTGRTFSPGLFEVMELLGRDVTLARLDAAARLRG
ncbi:MAG: glutamate--tRNA ligase [Deltaproteobacteria bacterium]|nr:glutamate--tRNA ligase [Deltaproteobacteria bacterium]